MPERINLGQGLAIVGAVALFVSLFLNWYEPLIRHGSGVSAWTAFELLDIVLAGLAVVAVVTALPLNRSTEGIQPPAGWLPWLGIAALVLVVVTLINDPPGIRDRGLDVGAWLGLAGAGVLATGGLLSTAQISLVVSSRAGRPVMGED